MINDLHLSADIQRVNKSGEHKWRLSAVQGTSKLVALGCAGLADMNEATLIRDPSKWAPVRRRVFCKHAIVHLMPSQQKAPYAGRLGVKSRLSCICLRTTNTLRGCLEMLGCTAIVVSNVG